MSLRPPEIGPPADPPPPAPHHAPSPAGFANALAEAHGSATHRQGGSARAAPARRRETVSRQATPATPQRAVRQAPAAPVKSTSAPANPTATRGNTTPPAAIGPPAAAGSRTPPRIAAGTPTTPQSPAGKTPEPEAAEPVPAQQVLPPQASPTPPPTPAGSTATAQESDAEDDTEALEGSAEAGLTANASAGADETLDRIVADTAASPAAATPAAAQQLAAATPASVPAATTAPPVETARNTAQPAPSTPPAAPPPAPPTIQIGVSLVRSAMGMEQQVFSLKLKPEQLGGVDVRLEVDRQGRAHAAFTVEKPETLQMLRQDSHHLLNTLKQAGLDADASSLSFSLKDTAQDRRGAPRQAFPGNSPSFDGDAIETAAAPPSPISNRLYDIHA